MFKMRNEFLKKTGKALHKVSVAPTDTVYNIQQGKERETFPQKAQPYMHPHEEISVDKTSRYPARKQTRHLTLH